MRFRTMRVKQEKRRRSGEVNLEADLQWQGKKEAVLEK